jgi:hypothetical protein
VKLRALDYAAIVVSLAAVAAFSLFAYSGSSGSELIIEASGSTWIYPLDETRTVRIHGPLGETIIEIGGGKAAVTDSPCPDKLCVHAGPVAAPGQWVACLPNAVMIRIGGRNAVELDDVSF